MKARRTPLTHQVYGGGAATLEGKIKLLYTERREVPDSTYGGFSDKCKSRSIVADKKVAVT